MAIVYEEAMKSEEFDEITDGAGDDDSPLPVVVSLDVQRVGDYEKAREYQ